MDKSFYVVIPYFPHPDVQRAITNSVNFFTGLANLFSKKEQHVTINEAELDAGKTELRNRVQSVLAGLRQSNIHGLPLDTQELIELYYDTYNPDTATRQQLKNFNDLTTDVVQKGQGAAPRLTFKGSYSNGFWKEQTTTGWCRRYSPEPTWTRTARSSYSLPERHYRTQDFIAPSSIEFKPDYFRLGTKLARTFYVYGYPRQLYTGWLSSFVNIDEVVDMSIYVYP